MDSKRYLAGVAFMFLSLNAFGAELKDFVSVGYVPVLTSTEVIGYKNNLVTGQQENRKESGDINIRLGKVYGDISRFYLEGGLSRRHQFQETVARDNVKFQQQTKLTFWNLSLGADWTPRFMWDRYSNAHFVLGGSVGAGLAKLEHDLMPPTSSLTSSYHHTYKGNLPGFYSTARAGVLFRVQNMQLEAGIKASFGNYYSKVKAHGKGFKIKPVVYDHMKVTNSKVGPYVNVGLTF